MLWFMGSQRVGHNQVMELTWVALGSEPALNSTKACRLFTTFIAPLESKCEFFKYYTHRLVQDGRAEGTCSPPPIKTTASCWTTTIKRFWNPPNIYSYILVEVKFCNHEVSYKRESRGPRLEDLKILHMGWREQLRAKGYRCPLEADKTKSKFSLEQGSPTPGPWTSTCPWPVWNQAAQKEVNSGWNWNFPPTPIQEIQSHEMGLWCQKRLGTVVLEHSQRTHKISWY